MAEVSQRKTVTVLFADLVESTSLAERLDAEALSEMLAGYFATMRRILERHGGTVEKFIGDAVVGMFGVQQTHEDDALRAVRAALEMQEAIGETQLRARMGINTGEVAVSSDSADPSGHMALGHAINMAARLEQAADPGAVLVGRRTLELVADSVRVTAVGPLRVRGSIDPIEAWRVTALLQVAPSGWDQHGAFVGRVNELAQIDSAFDAAVRERACVVVTVVAPPGMGKSRLAAEVTRRLDERALVLVGRCVPYGEGATYKPLIEIAGSAQLPADADPVNRARHALANTALASPEEAAWVFKQLLESRAEERPVVAVIDDLHWADPLLLDLLDYVATFSVDRPIMLLCLSRPDLFDMRPEWATPRPHAVTVRLAPLTTQETEALLEADETAAANPELRRRIIDASGGVPLFVEQMSALRSEGEGVVPPTVRALLAARIDRLHRAERSVLERAAIQGEVFERATLAALTKEVLDTPLASTLVALVRREFIKPERSADGGERFRFSHALLRDAVYEQMPRRMRAALHERYATLLEATGGDPEVIGHQLERAYAEASVVAPLEPATAELGLKAGRALRGAGLRALARKEWQRGRGLLERARELLAGEPSDEVAVLPDLVRAAGELGDAEGAADMHAQAVTGARSLGDASVELRAEIEWTQFELRRGNADVRAHIPQLVQRAVEHFTRVGDHAGLASALLLKRASPGLRATEIIEILREAHVHAERAGDERTQIEIWDELGGSMIFGPTPYLEILEFMEREAAWATERGIAFAEADGLLGQAYAAAASGETARARDAVAAVRALFAQLPGFVSQLGECDVLAASIEAEAGDLGAAEQLVRRARDVLERGGHLPWWTTASLELAHMLLDARRPGEAAEVLDELSERGLVWTARGRTLFLQARAKLASARADLDEALSLCRQAIEAVSDTEIPQYAARAHELLAELLAAAGDRAAATAELTRARDLYAAKAYRPGEARAAAKLSISET